MRTHGFIAALLLLVAATAAAQPASAPTDAQIAAQAEAYMQAAVGHDQFTGAVLVARDGQPVVSKAYGKANYELDVPNTPSTVFQIASLTKQFTAAAILQLQERGKLKTGDRICVYLDDCPQAWQPITLRQLLTHTSGLRNYSSLDEWDEVLGRKTYRPIELVDLFRTLPLEFAPGTQFKYSNSGYVLLGLVIERVSGQAYGNYLRDNMFVPLGMTRSVFDEHWRLILLPRYPVHRQSVLRRPVHTVRQFRHRSDHGRSFRLGPGALHRHAALAGIARRNVHRAPEGLRLRLADRRKVCPPQTRSQRQQRWLLVLPAALPGRARHGDRAEQ